AMGELYTPLMRPVSIDVMTSVMESGIGWIPASWNAVSDPGFHRRHDVGDGKRDRVDPRFLERRFRDRIAFPDPHFDGLQIRGSADRGLREQMHEADLGPA